MFPSVMMFPMGVCNVSSSFSCGREPLALSEIVHGSRESTIEGSEISNVFFNSEGSCEDA